MLFSYYIIHIFVHIYIYNVNRVYSILIFSSAGLTKSVICITGLWVFLRLVLLWNSVDMNELEAANAAYVNPALVNPIRINLVNNH